MADTKKPLLDGTAFFETVEESTSRPGRGYDGDAKQYDAASEHVLVLLGDAVDAFHRGSFGTSTFLAITALEETAKAELLIFRSEQAGTGPASGPDPLRSHKKKHRLAVRPTVFMGQRLVTTLGEDRCAELKSDAETGKLIALREASLYVEYGAADIVTPKQAVAAGKARDILLLALEAADDILVGWTDASYRLGDRIDPLFEEIRTYEVAAAT